jgi:conjugal transfer/entry exclusion protein
VTEQRKDGSMAIIIKGGSCHHNQGHSEATKQLMQARQMQDEQFRMMELMIETQPKQPRHHHHVPMT